MSSFSWILLIIGPVAFRKAQQSWASYQRRRADPSRPRGLLSALPSPLSSPHELSLLILVTLSSLYHLARLSIWSASDLFLSLHLPINAPSVHLRDALLSRSATGMFTEAQEALLQRLTSYEGRKIYLVLGPSPLLSCGFCNSTRDFSYYTLPFLGLSYACNLLLIGALTSGVPLADYAFGGLFRKLFGASPRSTTAESQNVQKARTADRSTWRRAATLVLIGALLVEVWAVCYYAEVRAGLGRMNHWHANLHLFRHSLHLLLPLLIYLFPSRTSSPALLVARQHLLSTASQIERTLSHLQSLEIGREVIMRDQGLRKTVEEWWDNHGADGGMSAKVGLLPPPIPSSSSNPPSNENDRPTNRLDDATLRAAARKARIDPLPIRAEANALADQVWRTVEEAARQDEAQRRFFEAQMRAQLGEDGDEGEGLAAGPGPGSGPGPGPEPSS